MRANDRRSDEQTATPEPQSGVQGEGAVGWGEGWEYAGRVGAVLLRTPEPDLVSVRQGLQGRASPLSPVRL